MSIFAPVYRPSKHQQTFLGRQQKLESRKRKRSGGSSDEDNVPTPSGQSLEPDPAPRTAPSSFHPVNKTDPYHIAGHPREEPLPPYPFPHAAVKEPGPSKRSVDEELAGLNPPLYVPANNPEEKSHSLRRRHLDNLTTVLHRCMLKGEWQRASRAWAILIRMEIAGRGIDVRRNGRWGIGAELLMRGGTQQPEKHHWDLPGGDDESRSPDETVEASKFYDEGFRLAREYYERLILQYPHTTRTQHVFNDTVIYPALFNIWIYEVQDRSKRARQSLRSRRTSAEDGDNEAESIASLDSEKDAQLKRIRDEELEAAVPIAQRMDELILSPPYDTNTNLLQLRGMVALWISYLHAELARIPDRGGDSDGSSIGEFENRSKGGRHRAEGEKERENARKMFGKLLSRGVELPVEVEPFALADTD